MLRFIDDDQAYLHWVAGNQHGFVINTERQPSPSYLVLHRATCGTISGTPARGRRWTADYIKICSGDRTALDRWAARHVGGALTPCGLCRP